MNYLFDTNVVSELARIEPDPRVAEWFTKLGAGSVFVSVITLGEIRRGIEALPEGGRRKRLTQWLESDLPAQFEDRVLDIDRKTADLWGCLGARARRPLPAVDALIAATALVHKLKLVTRNTRDFEYPGLSVINPWD